MTRDRRAIGSCPHCGGEPLECRYNHFENDGLTIDAWEHKCASCGHRETKAYRSDDAESSSAGDDPKQCPYCGRNAPTAS